MSLDSFLTLLQVYPHLSFVGLIAVTDNKCSSATDADSIQATSRVV